MDSREYRFDANVGKDEGESAISSLTIITLDGDVKPVNLFPTYDDLTSLRETVNRMISVIDIWEDNSVHSDPFFRTR